jgi:hypothetical protein
MKKKIQKKLTLKKATIVSFDNDSMRRIVGGVFDPFKSISFFDCESCEPGCSVAYPCNTNATCAPSNCETCGTYCTCVGACSYGTLCTCLGC